MTGGTRMGEIPSVLLDHLDVGVAVFDGAGRVTVWNAWLTRNSAIDTRDAIGKGLDDLFGDQVAPALVEAVASACQFGLSSVLSNQMHHRPLPLTRQAGGKLVEVEQSITVRALGGGNGPGCVMQVNDVTVAVRRERHLRESDSALRLRTRAIESGSQGVVIADARLPDMPLVYVNAAFTKITGYSPEEALGRNCRFLHVGEDDQPGLDGIRVALSEGHEVVTVLRNFRKDGSPFWNETLISPVRDAKGQISHFVGVQRDITERKTAQEALERALGDVRDANASLSREQRFTSAVLRTVGALVVVLDRHGRIVSFNRACEQLIGIASAAARGRRMAEFVPTADAAGQFTLDAHRVGGTDGIRTELIDAAGNQYLVAWALTVLADDDGNPSHLICTGNDITERERVSAMLRTEREVLGMVAQAENLDRVMNRLCSAIEEQVPSTRASVMILNPVTGQLNVAAAPSLPAFYIEGLDNLIIGPSAGSCGVAAFTGREVISADITTDPWWEGFHDLAEKVGIVACWSRPMLASTGVVLGTFAVYLGVKREPTREESEIMERAARLAAIALERHQAEERIRFLALYDPLTRLANRTLLGDRLQTAIAQARRSNGRFGLLFIDLDGFKAVNDTFGHDAGDDLLASLAGRLRACVRESDTVARIGGDEFVVLLYGLSGDAAEAEEAAQVVADKIIHATARPEAWQGHMLQVGASIGLAMFPDDGETADALLTRSDDAMYAAKQAGKGRVVRL